MPTTLTDNNISDTYLGLLHSQGAVLPGGGQVLIYDGGGNASSLRIGRAGEGATVSGALSANSLSVNGIVYPSSPGSNGSFLRSDGAGGTFFGAIPLSAIPALSSSPAGTYTGLSSITVDSAGRVTNVVTSGGSGVITSASMYVTPISLYSVLVNSPTTNATINCLQSNTPSDATYAVLQIVNEMSFNAPSVKQNRVSVIVNGAVASLVGSVWGNGEIYSSNYLNTNIWYAKMDSNNDISVTISRYFDSGTSNPTSFVQIYLLGYTNYNTLTNP